jgi:SAM-dependent methyltransferase
MKEALRSDSLSGRELKNSARMSHFIPNYLEPLIDKRWEVVSIGCGSGIDVEMLREDGYKAYGFDPSRDNHFALRKPEVQPFLRSGAASDFPFGSQRFDFAYALEVIEHVGCRNFGTHLLPGWREERVSFLRSSLALLRSPGRLLLSSSNRLCPIDPGHKHDYSTLGRLATKWGAPFGISIAWNEKNFLYSFRQLSADIHTIVPSAKVSTGLIANYPAITSRRTLKGRLAKTALSMVDFEPVRGSALAPLLVVTVDV